MENSTTLSDPFENTTHEDVYEDLLEKTTLAMNIFIELFTILSLVCIACNVIIGFVIVKYRRLRRDKSNIILLNWTIVNTFFMMSSPITYRLSMDREIYFAGYSVFCALEQAQFNFLLANLYIIVLLLINWYLKLYHPVPHGKFVKYLYFELAVIYMIVAGSLVYHVHACFQRFIALSELFLLLSNLIFIVFMIIMNIVHLVKRRRLANDSNISNMPLYLANTYFLSVCPLLLVFLSSFLFYHFVFSMVMVIAGLILAVMNPIYFFIILYRFDKDYRTFLEHIFSCKCHKYNDDELQEEPVVFNGSVQL